MKAGVIAVVLAAFGSFVMNAAPVYAAKPTITALGAKLTDSNNATVGGAGYQSITKNGNTKTFFEVGVFNLTQTAGTTLNILVNGNQVGTATVKTVRGKGRAVLFLSSNRGDTVPTVAANEAISVQLTDGTVVASGTFKTCN